MLEVLAVEEIMRRLGADVDGWDYVDGCLVRSVQCRRFAEGIRLVDAVAAVADDIDHHPDIDIRWTTVTFRLWTHVVNGITSRDFRLAREIDRLVANR